MISVSVPKVHYQDSQVEVSVRAPGEWHELRDFVKPYDPGVQRIYYEVGPNKWALADRVCRSIGYRSDNGEFWHFPSETIAQGYGDCDDSAILLCSLLRNFMDAYVAAGTYRGYGHAWVVDDGEILDTTYTRARLVPDPTAYVPYILFNEREVIELWPGALSRLFQLARDEALKLNLMNQVAGYNNLGTVLLLGIAGSLLGGILATALVAK